MSTLLKKGHFKPIDGNFMTEGKSALASLSAVQAKYKKGDIDNFLNELHDSMVGHYLGFKLVNVEKHGFDCKYSYNKDIFLESKVASVHAKSWVATFNDTTIEKAESFRSDKIWLALSLWENASDLICICYGQNPKIGEFLKDRVKNFKRGNGVRSTQSIAFTKLIKDYDFRILTISKSPESLLSFLSLKSKTFRDCVKLGIIDTLETFQEPYFKKRRK